MSAPRLILRVVLFCILGVMIVVWVMDRDGILHMRRARVVHIRDETLLVRLDVADDERIIVSQLRGATDGMKVRAQDREPQS